MDEPKFTKKQIDYIIDVVEQESFYDPETKETTFYTEQLVKRLRKLVRAAHLKENKENI